MTANGTPKRRWWPGSAVGGVIFLAAATAAILIAIYGFKGMIGRVDELQRVPASEAGAAVTLTEPGGYTIYYEAPGVNESPGRLPSVAVQPVDGAAPVEVRDYSSEFTYDFGGHEGVAVATFRLERPGRYRLRASGGGAGGGELAVGRAIGDGVGRALARAVAIGGLGLLLGGGIAVWTAIRQYKYKSAHPTRPPAPPPPTYAPPPPPPPPPPPSR